MRKWKLILVAAIQSILCIGCASSQNKSFPVETIEGIKLASVPVFCGVTDTKGVFVIKKILGSAFFINDSGYFLTANHVVKDWDTIKECKGDFAGAIYVPFENWQDVATIRYFVFTSCIKNEAEDVAICKTAANPFTDITLKRKIISITFGNHSSVRDGDAIAFTGFPLEYLRPVTSVGHIASSVMADNLFFIDKNAWPGASGSPVYMTDGSVIGFLIKTGINHGAGLTYAKSTAPVLDMLRKHKIEFNQAK